jgi:class 3 adenylate cyclase
VNVASRLESLGKDAKDGEAADNSSRILIGQATFQHLGDRFRTQRMGEVMLKGKDEAIIIYRVIG